MILLDESDLVYFRTGRDGSVGPFRHFKSRFSMQLRAVSGQVVPFRKKKLLMHWFEHHYHTFRIKYVPVWGIAHKSGSLYVIQWSYAFEKVVVGGLCPVRDRHTRFPRSPPSWKKMVMLNPALHVKKALTLRILFIIHGAISPSQSETMICTS